MALILAGEEFSIVQGMDVQGYLREIVANDTDPGLKITQSGSRLGLHLASGVAKFASDVDVLGLIKNTGPGNSGRVQIDDEVMITNPNSSWYLYLRDTNWGLLYDTANGIYIKF